MALSIEARDPRTGRIFIDVIGPIWWPVGQVCAMSIVANGIPDTGNPIMGIDDIPLTGRPEEDREAIADWLSLHTGDFSNIIDFSAVLPDRSLIPWSLEDSELAFFEATS